MAHETACILLDCASLLLDEGQARVALELATVTVPLFTARRLDRLALAALALAGLARHAATRGFSNPR